MIDPVQPGAKTITGTDGVPGATLEVELPNGTKVPATVNADGTWTADVPADVTLADGDKINATQTETGKAPTNADEVTVTAAPTDADKYDPTGQPINVTVDDTPNAVDGISNAKDMPEGTTYTFKEPVDTTTAGEKDAIVVVTYPDGTTDEVPVKVNVNEVVLPESNVPHINQPVAGDTEIKGTGIAGSTITVTLPDNTTATTTVKEDGTWSMPLTTAIEKDDVVKATQTEANKKPSQEITKTAIAAPIPDPPQTEAPDIKQPVEGDKTITGTGVPGATVTVKVPGEDPKTVVVDENGNWTVTPEKPLEKDVEITATQKDGEKGVSEVANATVAEKPAEPTDAEKNTPVGADIDVKVGETPKAEGGIANKGDLPAGTTYAFKDPVDTTTKGDFIATVVVTYPDGSKDEVKVVVKVREKATDPTDADKYTPVGTDIAVKVGETAKAEAGIANKGDLPAGTTYAFKNPVNTLTPGDKPAIIVVTYPDGTTDEVAVTVKVTKVTPKPVPGGGSVEEPSKDMIVDRIEGIDRYETANKISQDSYDRAKIAIIVNGHRFPDALTATVLADVKNAPLLLVDLDSIPEKTIAELKRLGVEKVIIVGGTSAVSQKVEDMLKLDHITERIGGIDRYETAALVADRVTKLTGNKSAVVIARGDDFPDALTISALAIKESTPILLVRPNSIPEFTKARLDAYNPSKITVAGLTAAVSANVETQLKAYAPVTRLGGQDRYETATVIAAYTYPTANRAIVASGEVFIDALAAGPLTNDYGAPILLVGKNHVPQALKNYLAGEGSEIKRLTIIGGVNAISAAVEAELKK